MSEPKLSEEGERLIRDYQEAVDSFGYVFSRNHKFEPAFDKLCKSLAALRARMAYLESRVAELEADKLVLRNQILHLSGAPRAQAEQANPGQAPSLQEVLDEMDGDGLEQWHGSR